jgi:hypothetical protein
MHAIQNSLDVWNCLNFIAEKIYGNDFSGIPFPFLPFFLSSFVPFLPDGDGMASSPPLSFTHLTS